MPGAGEGVGVARVGAGDEGALLCGRPQKDGGRKNWRRSGSFPVCHCPPALSHASLSYIFGGGGGGGRRERDSKGECFFFCFLRESIGNLLVVMHI